MNTGKDRHFHVPKKLTRLKRYFFSGIVALAPVVVTIFLLWKSFLFLDGILSKVMNAILRQMTQVPFFETHSIPGLGFIALIVLVTLTGFAARNMIGQLVLHRIQRWMNQIPLVNRIYKTIRQISEAVLSGRQNVFHSAVLIEYPRKGIYSIGIMTADTGGKVQASLPEDTISLFLPTTPNPTSGFLLFVPKKDVIPLDISVEEALKLIISGGTINIPSDQEIELLK